MCSGAFPPNIKKMLQGCLMFKGGIITSEYDLPIIAYFLRVCQ